MASDLIVITAASCEKGTLPIIIMEASNQGK
jgi:hypothetical protein